MTRYPLLFKTIMIAALTLLLLIPLGMIESKISERKNIQTSVQAEVAQSASGVQTLSGPYLIINYKVRIHYTDTDALGKDHAGIRLDGPYQLKYAPKNLKINGQANVEERSRGIYKARLYNLNSNISGEFTLPVGLGIKQAPEDILIDNAYLAVDISDSRGIRNSPTATINNTQYTFEAGSPLSNSGIHANLGQLSLTNAYLLKFSFPLELQGMSTLSVVPSGDDTEMRLTSTWPHPSFGGQYLPRSREINAKGFNALWRIPKLARNNVNSACLSNLVECSQSLTAQGDNKEAFSVGFVDPVNVYLQSERAVKYAIMFIVLIFTAFFLFETLKKMRIHPLQYLLVGLAMAMFFLLVISLSEHISFALAYLLAGVACIGLIGIYLAGLLQSYKPASAFSAGIALLYGVLYGVLQSEDNALLMGSMILFGALATVMLLTRKMDWYSISDNKSIS